MFDPLSILAAFAPIAVQGAQAAVQRWLAPEKIKPMTVAEAVQLEQVDIDRLKVIADLDRPSENISPWVSNMRAMMRPTIAFVVTLAWAIDPESAGATLAAQSVWFYLFGERTIRK